MKVKRKLPAILLAFALVLTWMPYGAFPAAAAGSSAALSIGSVTAAPGGTVDLTVRLEHNPGILGAVLTLTYDRGLTLTAARAGEAFSALSMTPPGSFASPCNFVWDGQELPPEDVKDGVILTLTFQISEEAAQGEALSVGISPVSNSVVDASLRPVSLEGAEGAVTVQDGIPGDVNHDGDVTVTDVILLRRYLAGGYDVTINEWAADGSGDGSIGVDDLIRIRRHLAGWPDQLRPSPSQACEHDLDEVAYQAPTETSAGNIAYWHCAKCGKLFSDAGGTHEISASDVVLSPTPPSTPSGRTHAVVYDITNGDPYLETLLERGEIVNPNPGTFSVETGLMLRSLSVRGYRFVGWYDGAGRDSTRVQTIAPNTDYDVELFAHWEKYEYTVQFQSDIFKSDMEKRVTYTVDEGLTLPTPKVGNYIFTGWSDEDGYLYRNTMIPVGTIGNIVLKANWTSERNKTWTNPHPQNPVIVEDEDAHVILFAYEIGMIENIPVSVIKDFGYVEQDGVSRTEEATYSETTQEDLMTAYTSTVAKATTESSSWTLSSEWNESTSINEEAARERGYSREEAEEIARSSSNTWNVSSGRSGSTETTHLATGERGWENSVKIGAGTEHESGDRTKTNQSFNVGANLTYTPKNYSVGVGDVSVGAGGGWGGGLNVGYSNGREKESWTTDKSSLNVEFAGKSSGSHLTTDSTTSTSSWNSSSSYGGSETIGRSNSVSTALSEAIRNTYSYGNTYIQGGSDSRTQGLSSTQSLSDEYANSVTYSTIRQTERTQTWTTSGTKAGYHRWVYVNSAHIFAVVGYKMEEQSYFVYTYSVMDDAPPQPFEDYSNTTGQYNDHENGVISFEIPYEVAEYVTERMSSSNGLRVDQRTGKVESYTGSDTCVVIPEYYHVDNNVVKVTGIEDRAFRGNTQITGVVLSDYITEIPDGAFEGCTALQSVYGKGVTRIGDSAFRGCTSMLDCAVTPQVTHLGTEAFQGADGLLAVPANAEVAEAAAQSGAKKTALYLQNLAAGSLDGKTLSAPDTAEYFEIYGSRGSFSDLAIQSDADKTVINRANFVGEQKIPLQLSSPEVVLNEVTVRSSGLAAVLSAESTHLGMQDTILLESSGENTLLCKNLSLYESNPKVVGRLHVAGKLLICGSVEGEDRLTYDSLSRIDEETFQRMLHSYTLTFDPNGGTCSELSRAVTPGAPIGALPQPERPGFQFAGWYLDLNDETSRVTAETALSPGTDQTVHAKWSVLGYTVSWNAGTGATIAVRRTASPHAGAPAGNLSSGAEIFYGDTLEASYSAQDGYTLGDHGAATVTVTGNVGPDAFYASASPNDIAYQVSCVAPGGSTLRTYTVTNPYNSTHTIDPPDITGYGKPGAQTVRWDSTSPKTITFTYSPNRYTYSIVYRSSNGADLGGRSETYEFGTTQSISAPGIAGYATPEAQNVAWDSTSGKTITFTYTPNSVGTQTLRENAWWWQYNGGSSGIRFTLRVSLHNRTANSVQATVTWTNTITARTYYGFWQAFNVAVGNGSTGTIRLAENSTWSSSSSQARSVEKSATVTVTGLSPTTTSVPYTATASSYPNTSHPDSFSGTLTIPTY